MEEKGEDGKTSGLVVVQGAQGRYIKDQHAGTSGALVVSGAELSGAEWWQDRRPAAHGMTPQLVVHLYRLLVEGMELSRGGRGRGGGRCNEILHPGSTNTSLAPLAEGFGPGRSTDCPPAVSHRPRSRNRPAPHRNGRTQFHD